ncbi:hypothetical protein JOC94_003205 [Bacillus thermophilus]|uniref:Uncharacterized protein n=1 Tax=Siminovitchia thermophila TaxID=1245522 RepID=A0ABS2RAH7_9BACI|nr:hypothetical protein [Siminovitchia thermophila]
MSHKAQASLADRHLSFFKFYRQKTPTKSNGRPPQELLYIPLHNNFQPGLHWRPLPDHFYYLVPFQSGLYAINIDIPTVWMDGKIP